MAKTKPLRKPLGKREARIIQRLRSVAKMPVAKIALVTEGDKTTTRNVLSCDARFVKGGAKAKLSNYFVAAPSAIQTRETARVSAGRF